MNLLRDRIQLEGIGPSIKEVERSEIKEVSINEPELTELYFAKVHTKAGYVTQIKLPVIPKSLVYSYSPNFQTTNVLGRMTPFYLYTSGSDEIYSFSIDLHEDLHGLITEEDKYKEDTEKRRNLKLLVEQIKSLSFPHIDNKSNVSFMPHIYFQLGKIKAYVKVDTDVVWKKPFRDGRYIFATVTFRLTVLDKLEDITITKYEEIIESLVEGDYIYKDGISYVFTEHDSKIAYAMAGTKIRYLSNSRIINSSKLVNTEVWDNSKQRLKKLFGTYKAQSEVAGAKEYSKFLKEVESLATKTTSNLLSEYNTYNDLEKKVKTLKKEYSKFLDYYYDKISGVDSEEGIKITLAQVNLLKQQFSAILDNLLLVGGGFIGYGASK